MGQIAFSSDPLLSTEATVGFPRFFHDFILCAGGVRKFQKHHVVDAVPARELFVVQDRSLEESPFSGNTRAEQENK